MKFTGEKANQIALLGQQTAETNNANKAMTAAPNNGKTLQKRTETSYQLHC